MGEVAETLTKKKKKGRPSLLDLQKRALKQQQLLIDPNKDLLRSDFNNPNSLDPDPNTRSNTRRNSNSDDDDERREKKHRLLHGLNSHDFKSENPDASSLITRRKIHGSEDTGQKAWKTTDIFQRSLVEEEKSGPFTPLPDKKLLLFILDRVQKKDTYGVYSDPADPEELPDYHEIIKNPMDFSTLRKKLESGAYATLEQFEEDVFLICTNAMEYNPADTIYHRQARAMLEIAKKDFGNLRQESDEEEEEQVSRPQQPKVVKRGRPPGTGHKKHPELSSIDRTTSEVSADGDGFRLSGAYNLRKTPPSYRIRQAETSVRINHNSENQSGFLIDWEKEFPPSVVKAVNKYGMKNVDESKRDTYNHISTSLQEASILTTLDDDLKQLTPVGLKTEYGYARSLARYVANLGPVAWRFANRRIETVLPTGTEFGPGWVGENPEAPPLISGKQNRSNDLESDESKESAPAARLLNQETESNGLDRSLLPNVKQEFIRFPPDLNAKVVSPNSPVSNLQVGSSQHPDLALQL